MRHFCLLMMLFSLCVQPAFAQRSLALRPAPSYALTASQLAVVINDEDPNSVEIGNYYLKLRKIPVENLVHIKLKSKSNVIDEATFLEMKKKIFDQLEPHIQAIVLVWTSPYAVECNSITSAMAFGFDAQLCKRSCAQSRGNPYFNSSSTMPYRDLGIRPTMLLPTDSMELAKNLIGRGVAAGKENIEGSAYFLRTSDPLRNSRAGFFPPNVNVPKKKLHIKTIRSDNLVGASDIIIYETGRPWVEKLETLHFLPGALADHLTSLGGDLLGKNQMSSLRWLEAGATASYGSVSEPCNYWQKFPHPSVLLKHYLAGASALEAYLKSVAWPAQGLLIGEPLATPYPN